MKDFVGFVGGELWTPSDTVRIRRPTRGFQVAVAGDVSLGYPDGTNVTWPACVAGVQYAHYGFVFVRSLGTTATGIVVGY